MAVPFSNTKLRVPKGFQNILEGLARECLRSQPENIFEFGAKYFEQLLQVREQTGHDPAVHGSRLEDRFYNNDSFKSPTVDVGDPQQQEAATTIQTEFRRHAAEKEVEEMKKEEAAIKIQSGFRGHQDREKVAEMKDPESQEKQQKESDESVSKGGGEEEVDIDLNDPEVAEAAVKIQAGFKGYKARKEVKDRKEQSPTEIKPSSGPSEQEMSEAATKIQAGFRGHKTRQEVKEKMNQETEEVNINLNDPEIEKAAIRIQAGFRGHQARTEIRQKMDAPAPDTEEEVDIDLNDPEVEQAALKIQAGFKGYKTRQEIKTQKVTSQEPLASPSMNSDETYPELSSNEAESNESQKVEDEVIDIDLTDPEVEKAAVKIQAGFSRFKARKEADIEKDTEIPKPVESSPKESSEEVDIDLTDPEVEQAALKIQAGFKGYKTRKDFKDQKGENDNEPAKPEEAPAPSQDIDMEDPETEQAVLKIQAGFRGYKTRKEVKEQIDSKEPATETKEEKSGEKQEEEVDIDLTDPEVEQAALKIQAGFKGYQTRKEMKEKGGGDEKQETENKEEEVDIDLDDPEVEKAATKIQAGFKGYKTRKEMKNAKGDETGIEKQE